MRGKFWHGLCIFTSRNLLHRGPYEDSNATWPVRSTQITFHIPLNPISPPTGPRAGVSILRPWWWGVVPKCPTAPPTHRRSCGHLGKLCCHAPGEQNLKEKSLFSAASAPSAFSVPSQRFCGCQLIESLVERCWRLPALLSGLYSLRGHPLCSPRGHMYKAAVGKRLARAKDAGY